MTSDSSPNYENPPINEVVCGVAFTPLERFKISHFGLFWYQILEQFPRCEQAPPLGNVDEIVEPEFAVPVPRLWFINQEDDHLIQLQRNRFFFNWRKRADTYPRFRHVYNSFSNNFDRFQKFIEEYNLGDIKVVSYELTYINLLMHEEGWDNLDNMQVMFPSMTWGQGSEKVLPPTKNLAWQRDLSLPDHPGILTLKLQSGIRKPDERPLLRLESTVRGSTIMKSAEMGMSQWFDIAHIWINRAFENIIAPEVQKNVWGKIC